MRVYLSELIPRRALLHLVLSDRRVSHASMFLTLTLGPWTVKQSDMASEPSLNIRAQELCERKVHILGSLSGIVRLCGRTATLTRTQMSPRHPAKRPATPPNAPPSNTRKGLAALWTDAVHSAFRCTLAPTCPYCVCLLSVINHRSVF